MNSPFSRAKFEESTDHIYFLPAEITTNLENARSTVLFGSRGSGKTTLLRALDWKERVNNKSLRQQLNESVFRGRFIGVYTKLSLHSCKSMDVLHAAGTVLEGQIFGFYLDLLAIELVAASVSNIISQGIVVDTPGHLEHQVAETLITNWSEILTWAGVGLCRTLTDVAKAASRIRQELERWSQHSCRAADLAKEFRIPGFGEFSRSIAPQIGDLCSSGRLATCNGVADSDAPWHFKICFDEAEVLSAQQQLVINTLIRVAEAPLLLVVSYVSRPVDLSQTLLPHLTLQKADLQQLSLDGLTLHLFKELAEGVATVRCQQALCDTAVVFRTARTLGPLSLNRLVDAILNESEKAEADQLRTVTAKFREAWKDTATSEFPPYIEAFLAERLSLTPADPSEYKGERKQKSEEFRKKMVVGYLAICRLLGRRHVPFAFGEMLLGVSDRCIRDFLHQLHSLFVEKYPTQTPENLSRFLTVTVEWKSQDAAIRKASEEKRDSIPRSGVLRPVQIRRLVSGLAQVTALLQSHAPTGIDAGFTERGIFRLIGGSPAERVEMSQLVRDAAEAGFLRLVGTNEQSDSLDGFRVHGSLAPAFGFSYRGAYYGATLDAGEFRKIIECSDEISLKRLVESLASKKGPETDPQGRLFDDDEFNGRA